MFFCCHASPAAHVSSLSSLKRKSVMPTYSPTHAPCSCLAHSPHVPPHREPHTWMDSLYIAASPHARPKGSSLPRLHTPGYSPSSSWHLLMKSKEDSHSLRILLMWLLTGNHTPGGTPSSSSCLRANRKRLSTPYTCWLSSCALTQGNTHLDALPLLHGVSS